MKFLVTGGSGFIGSGLIQQLLQNDDNQVVNLDALTYAANPMSLTFCANDPRYAFIHADVTDAIAVGKAFEQHQPDVVMHLAAESHVDHSIRSPARFINTNVIGTATLLEQALGYFESLQGERQDRFRFHHVSTDEVFGDLKDKDPAFSEKTAYAPSSPYSASKAASDHLVRAWYRTYQMPVVLSNCSNNYGPRQFPEKFIPRMLLNALSGKSLPVYGDGLQIRDWLYVEDHAHALERVTRSGAVGSTYCIGGNDERTNLEVVHALCDLLEELEVPKCSGVRRFEDLIQNVPDRPGHDRRYAISSERISSELDWRPKESFETGLRKTVQWYLENEYWWRNIVVGSSPNWGDHTANRPSVNA